LAPAGLAGFTHLVMQQDERQDRANRKPRTENRELRTDMFPYRDVTYPLNVFMHILMGDEGGVTCLHYALFEHEGESIAMAQERSTEILLARLPQPPARILEAGIGLGTTLARLTRAGYDAVGITPDRQQIAMVRDRFGDELRVECVAFEQFEADRPFDVVVFQESSQYIPSEALFAKAKTLTRRVLVLDEFALKPIDTPGALHSLEDFLAAAERHGFAKLEELDLSAKAAPTIDYFLQRIPRYRESLKKDLGITDRQVDDLLTSNYRQLYREGVYGYRLLVFGR
jgi:SAM-dependent methyltransferase